MLVIRQEGVQRRVFFDPSYDGHVATMPELVEPSWLTTRDFLLPFERWQKELAKRRDIFFGYCGSSDETARLRCLALEPAARSVRAELLAGLLVQWLTVQVTAAGPAGDRTRHT